MACVASGCKSRMGELGESNNKISFHRFPKDPEIKKKWIRNINRSDWAPSLYSRLCSLHFHNSCYRPGYHKKVLHSDAVPTIFGDASTCTKKLVRRSRPSRTEMAVQSSYNKDNIIKGLRRTIQEQQMVIRKLQHTLKQYEARSEIRRRNLKTMRQRFHRTFRKLADSNNKINEFQLLQSKVQPLKKIQTTFIIIKS